MADLKIDEYIKYQERLIESLDFDATLNQSLSSAKKSMYDFIDTLREEKMEMDKQLKANMQIDDWLTEDTRKQLFNLDDYEEQMGVINELQADSESLYLKYQNDLANLKEDELYKEEEITAEYNRQMEALQDKLGIAKAELQLAKDKAAFENALLERDTQIIMGNRVQNVADPERLRDAAEKLAESENELINQQTKKTEADDIRLMEHETGLINLEKGAIQNRVDMINEMSDEEKRAFADFLEPIDVISAKLTTLSKVNPDRIIRGDNSNSVYLSRDFSKMAGYSLSTDHSGIVDLMDNLFNNGYFKEGTDAYEVAQLIKQWSKYQHDDKTTSDAHNYGYDLYDPENAYLWGRGALTMYSDEVFKTFAQEYVPIYEYMSNLMSKAVTNALENTPIVSGEGDVIFANSGTTVADILKDYQEASIEELFTRLTNDPEKAQSLVESFKVGSIAPSADALKSLSDLFAKAVAVDVMNGNGNSTVIMENVNVTLEKQPQNVNSFVANLTEKTMTEFDLTKNR